MHRYVIERDLPGAGNLSASHLNEVRQISNAAVRDTGPGIQWVESFVTADRMYCHYLAENEQLVRTHAERAGLPCTKISEVRSVVDRLTANMQNI
jgi:hypothetical protein